MYMHVYIGCHNECVKSLGYTVIVRCQRTHWIIQLPYLGLKFDDYSHTNF